MDEAEKKNEKDMKDKINKFVKDNKDKIKYLMQFSFVVLIYGSLSNFALSQIITISFSLKNLLAYGLVAYFIKAELPNIISGCFPKRPPIIPT